MYTSALQIWFKGAGTSHLGKGSTKYLRLNFKAVIGVKNENNIIVINMKGYSLIYQSYRPHSLNSFANEM